jgi:hypothetical protein
MPGVESRGAGSLRRLPLEWGEERRVGSEQVRRRLRAELDVGILREADQAPFEVGFVVSRQ